jgi:hypothetical protein
MIPKDCFGLVSTHLDLEMGDKWNMVAGQKPSTLVKNINIAGKWMEIHLDIVILIGFDPRRNKI